MLKKITSIVFILAMVAFVVIALYTKSGKVNKNDDFSGNKAFSVAESIVDKNAEVSLERIIVTKIIDGDTIKVKKSNEEEITVRLIGVNTPESVSSNKAKNCEEGKKASDYMKTLLYVGCVYYLQYDVSKKDTYDRTLAYVWLSNNVDINNKNDIEENMVNAILLKNGYANVMTVKPNVKYKSQFEQIRDKARRDKVMFWSQSEKPIPNWEN